MIDIFDQEDLRIVAAVARTGALPAAARQLGINHSTVFRRLSQLEDRLGVRLFERTPQGYTPTTAGAEMIAGAERIVREVENLNARLTGHDMRLTGSVRLTAPDDLAAVLLPEPLAAFRREQPGITIEMVVENRNLSLTRREADLAVRPTPRPPEAMAGRRIGPLASAVYAADAGPASRNTSDTTDAVADEERVWIAWEEGAGPAAANRWLYRHVPAERIVYRSNSLLNQMEACRTSLGAALLPCFLGDRSPGLMRLTPAIADAATELWLLVHPDLRRTARVRALSDHLYEALVAERPLLAGQA